VVDSGELNTSVLDNLALLWAARNLSYAEELSKTYFDDKLRRYEYRVTVTEGDTTSEIYSTSPVPEDISLRAVASRPVSGYKIDRPSEGFRARARAVKASRNTTEIFSLPAVGYVRKNGKMEVRKQFHVENAEKIWNATMYLSVDYSTGQSVEQLKLNDDQEKDDIKTLHDNGDTLYGVVNITGSIQKGENNLLIRLKGGQSNLNRLQPGSFIEVKYRQAGSQPLEEDLRHRRIFFEDVELQSSGSKSGIFKVESFDLGEESDFVNATFKLNASGLDTQECGDGSDSYEWDVKTVFNGDGLYERCVDGASDDFVKEYELSEDQVQNGTNVLSVYLESFEDTFWGNEAASLNSDFETESSSHIDLWYRQTDETLDFGRIDVTSAERIGGGVANPKTFDKAFEQESLQSTQVYIAQRRGDQLSLGVNDGTGYENVFSSPGPRATPTRILVSPESYSTSNQNTVRLEDTGEDSDFYPESRFLWTVSIPSQVGYGDLHSTRSEAVQDARQRLQDTLGSFVDATNIQSDTVSTGDQPYLWGPARVRVEVWRR
jgi:hypothetical protein